MGEQSPMPMGQGGEGLRERLEQPLGPEEEAQAPEIIRNQRPWEAERLEKVKANRPNAYNMLLRQALLGERMMDRARQEDPEAFERRKQELDLERQEHELAMQYQQAQGEKAKKELEAQLKDLLGKHFDLRSENHKREIKRAEEQLARLREQMEAREKNRGDIIKRKSMELLGQGGVMEF